MLGGVCACVYVCVYVDFYTKFGTLWQIFMAGTSVSFWIQKSNLREIGVHFFFKLLLVDFPLCFLNLSF